MDFKQEIIKILKKETIVPNSSGKAQTKQKEINLEIPPNPALGDYAFPCFSLVKVFKKAPNEIAEELAKKIQLSNVINKIEVKGPYLNFFVNKEALTKQILNKIYENKEYGKAKKINQRVVIEYPSPNTNKPLHLGHVRNLCIGSSIARILRADGYDVIEVNLNNDRGIHICKSMLAYKLWGKGKKPRVKTDHFVGKFYVMFEQKADDKLEEEVYDMLKKWESDDKETIKLWQKMNKWAVDGFNETYKRLGIKYCKVYNESQHYKDGKKIVLEALKKKIFEKDKNGNIIANLEKYNLPNKVVLRGDNTAVYATQDIFLAKLKSKEFKPKKSIYVVGSEQDLYFKQLFKILELVKLPNIKGLIHLSHGMIYLPEGRMKSREGKVVDADDIIDEMINLARKELRKRYKDLSKKEIEERAEKIGLGALKFFILRYDPSTDFTFNPEESISFEGETGPYCQYSYARICSILRKYGKKVDNKVDFSLLKEKDEQLIINLLGEFPAIVKKAGLQYKPHYIARYLLDLSQTFNTFYHNLPVLKAEENVKKARLVLIECVKRVLGNGLGLLGIDVLEKM